MMRAASIAIATALAAGTLGAGCASAPPSAEEIVARNVAARGGLEAWRKVETMVWVGHIESAHAAVPDLQFALEQKRPNKTRLELHAMGQGSIRIFDGVHGWRARPSRGRPELQSYTPEELKFAQTSPGLDGPLIDHAAKGNSVSLVSLDDLEGRKAYHLKVDLAKGGDEDVWVDAKTYLDMRYDRTAEEPGGARRRVSVTYGDYRTVDGLKIPFLVETAGGAYADKMRIDTAVVNPPLDDSTFEKPDAHRQGRVQPGVVSRADVTAAPPGGERGAAPR
jgi:hypothetical protein